MRRLITLLFVLFLAVANFSWDKKPAIAQAGGWVTKASMRVPRSGLAAVAGKDGRIYVFGGASTSQVLGSAEVYTPSTDSWAPIAPLPTARSDMGAALGPDGRIYVVGGWDGQRSINTMEAYNPSTNTWECSFHGVPGCAAVDLAPMPTPRSTLGVTAGADGQIYAIGGFTTVPVATVEVYNPTTNSWSTGPALPRPDAGVAATTASDGTVYAIGGFDGQHYLGTTNTLSTAGSAAKFVTHTNFGSWSSGSDQDDDEKNEDTSDEESESDDEGAKSQSASAGGSGKGDLSKVAAQSKALAGGEIYALGGTGVSGVVNLFRIYQRSTGTWTNGPPMPTARSHAAAVTLPGDIIYVIGGDNEGNAIYNTVEAFVPPPAPTATPTNTVIAPTATSTPTSTPTPTATPVPTRAPSPLTVRIKVKSHRVAAGHQQQITITTFPKAHVAITATYPNGKKLRHSGTAGATGTLTWRFKEPGGYRSGLKVKLAVTVTDASGRTAHASGSYTTG